MKRISPKILIVDDEPINLQILGTFLEKEKFDVSFATSGIRSLELMEQYLPDLILLDVMMPEMDGFEVSKIIRKKWGNESPPIIFLTARAQSEDIIEGFSSGGVDYVTKPFVHQELLIRIKTHLEIRENRKRLEKQKKALENLSSEKTELLSIAAHDIKNPISGISGCSKAILDALQETENESYLENNEKELLQIINHTAQRVMEIVHSVLELQDIDSEKFSLNPSAASVNQLAKEVISLNQYHAQRKKIKVHFHDTEEDLWLRMDLSCMREVLDNLLSNAIKYSMPESEIYFFVNIEANKTGVTFSVKDQGPGLTEKDKTKLFLKFQKLSARPTGGESSTGLGLAICKRIVELHQGKIWAENNKGGGSTFFAFIPHLED